MYYVTIVETLTIKVPCADATSREQALAIIANEYFDNKPVALCEDADWDNVEVAMTVTEE